MSKRVASYVPIDLSAQKEDHCTPFPSTINLLAATIQEFQNHLRDGTITSVQLVSEYLVSIILLQ
jgi:hypothetical protein